MANTVDMYAKKADHVVDYVVPRYVIAQGDGDMHIEGIFSTVKSRICA